MTQMQFNSQEYKLFMGVSRSISAFPSGPEQSEDTKQVFNPLRILTHLYSLRKLHLI